MRRSLFGYRRADVEAALAERDGRLAQASERLALQGTELDARAIELMGRERRIDDLEQVTAVLSERLVERERELSALRSDLARPGDGEGTLAALEALARELDDVRRAARGQATRLRLRALSEAAAVADRVDALSRRPEAMRERLLEALAEAIERIGLDDADVHGRAEVRPLRSAAELFDGRVEVEIGPLSDFSQLVGFEDAAKSIDATGEIAVKRFSEGRATLDIDLREPTELLRELERRSDLEFQVRDMRANRLVLDVGEGEPPAAAGADGTEAEAA